MATVSGDRVRSHDDPRYAVPHAIDEWVKRRDAIREEENPSILLRRERNRLRWAAQAKAGKAARQADADKWIAEIRARRAGA